MDNEKEYYYSGSYFTIYGEVTNHPDMVIITDGSDYGELIVVRKKELIPKEESYTFKQALKRKHEIEEITAQAEKELDALVDKVVDKALKALSARMRLNAFFGKDIGNATGWAMMVVQELEDLIKEKAPETIKKKESYL